mmetsp:Transcript_27389/g.63935  ORF Transcript_27389/g.63935 Transcript_27389/m.63935 type:complete len:204 (+) Transcript_27389:80-691(+)
MGASLRPMASIAVLLSAAEGQGSEALQKLQSMDLSCATCRFIWSKLDADLAEVKRVPPKKRAKKLRSKWTLAQMCSESRFGERMGVASRTGRYTVGGGEPGGLDKELLADAFEYARGAGFGHNGNEELQQVAAGTHKEVWVDRKLNKLVASACNHWYDKDHVEAAIEAIEEVLIDGSTLKEQICGARLQVCPFEEEGMGEEEL